jgi:hypothetical protein
MQPEIAFGAEKLANFEEWREGIMEKVKEIENART